MKFAELRQGMVIEGGPITITEADILDFATKYDPQWFHTDPKRASEGRWGGLIASGWHTCSVTMRMAVDAIFHDSDCFGSPGLGEVRWRVPVRPGDILRLSARVIGVRESSSRDGLGIVTWLWKVSNQRGEVVLEIDATNLFDFENGAEGGE